jgi:hypothetical protein
MSLWLRNTGLLLSALLGLSAAASASVTATVTGGETQRMDQSWDIGPLQVSVNVGGVSYVETIYYGQYSTPASVASQIAGRFSNDCAALNGLCAHASGTTITFMLTGAGAAFGSLTVSGPTNSFQLSGSGFAAYNWTPSSRAHFPSSAIKA